MPKTTPMEEHPATPPGRAPDDVWSAPESGTVREDTCGNQPSERNNGPGHRKPGDPAMDDPSYAGEEP